MKNKHLACVGYGSMAQAMISSLVERGLIARANIIASGPNPEKLANVGQKFSIRFSTSNRDAVSNADFVFLATKPQNLPEVAKEIGGRIPPEATVISILAGVPISTLETSLAHRRIVRAMPNLPACIQKGITVWTATSQVADADLTSIAELLSCFGKHIYVKREGELDMATALSGTGPAYLFLYAEAMIDAGVHLGLSREISTKLVYETISGSISFAIGSEIHPVNLRNAVTSPNGTTADALYELEKGGFRTVISDAVWAAFRKSRSLGEK
jgi:pyrroline-5-carboxylate reductase